MTTINADRPKIQMAGYPEAQGYTGGCNVGWLFYESAADAKKAAGVAKHKAIDKANRGFDFGFQTPGEIDKSKDGLFMVCIP